ncbi:MAG: hypothetical protein HY717_11220 [Planctomycetes bacterium]|nr:hypothetical protein [Planctomycetota bacterium]
MNDLTVKFKVNFRKVCWRRKEPATTSQHTPKEATPSKATAIAAKPGATPIARMLALAYYVERQVEAGAIRDYASAARWLGISRARMTQVMNLLNLPVPLQETILAGGKDLSERQIRKLHVPQWGHTKLGE